MPEKEYLDDFYKESYQFIRHNLSISEHMEREKVQLKLIRNTINYDFKNKDILNFGSGLGGFSDMIQTLQGNVTDIDMFRSRLSKMNNSYFYDDIQKIKNQKFDFIYTSHTLEHLYNIKPIIKKFIEFEKTNTVYFIEVPNGNFQLKSLFFPHTHFFKKEFFENLFNKKNETNDFFYLHNYNTKSEKTNDESDNISILTNRKINKSLILNSD